MRAAAVFALISVALWSFFGYFATRLAVLPPLLLVGMTMLIAGLASLPTVRTWRVPWRIHLLGIAGIGGNMLLYFSSFRFAPAVEVNLENYVWPLLTILATPLFLPDKRLHPHHLVGAGIGFSGTALVILAGPATAEAAHASAPALGYTLCGLGTVCWTCYSLLTRRVAPFPTTAVGGFCLSSGVVLIAAQTAVAVLADPAHARAAAAAAVTAPLAALDGREWVLLVLCGIGPMGLAYFSWDAAMKRGDPRITASIAFLTPLFSTLILALVGGHPLTWAHGVAVVLIIGGAVVGSWDLFAAAPPAAASEIGRVA